MPNSFRLFWPLSLLSICIFRQPLIASCQNLYTIVDTNQARWFDETVEIDQPDDGSIFSLQDSGYLGNSPSYTNNGDGTITDENTGLVWTADRGENRVSWASAVAAIDYMNSESYLGYNDWRVPTVKELYSLIDFSGLDPTTGEVTSSLVPFIDSSYFPFEYGTGDWRVIDTQYVTSTEYLSPVEEGIFFGVNFGDGRIKGYPTSGEGISEQYFALYVRGNPDYGLNSFSLEGDIVVDSATGLTWTRADSGVGLDWPAALAYCGGLAAGGHADWRLPSAKELQGLVDYARSPDGTGTAALDPAFFEATPLANEAGQQDWGFYWTSTTHRQELSDFNAASYASRAVYVAFGRALGYSGAAGTGWTDVHGAGAQRSDPKTGDPADYPTGYGPQGDAVRIYNMARCVRGGGVAAVGGAAAAAAAEEEEEEEVEEEVAAAAAGGGVEEEDAAGGGVGTLGNGTAAAAAEEDDGGGGAAFENAPLAANRSCNEELRLTTVYWNHTTEGLGRAVAASCAGDTDAVTYATLPTSADDRYFLGVAVEPGADRLYWSTWRELRAAGLDGGGGRTLMDGWVGIALAGYNLGRGPGDVVGVTIGGVGCRGVVWSAGGGRLACASGHPSITAWAAAGGDPSEVAVETLSGGVGRGPTLVGEVRAKEGMKRPYITSVSVSTKDFNPHAIAVSSALGRIYFSDNLRNTISFCDSSDGGNPQPFLSNVGPVHGMVIWDEDTGSTLFYTDTNKGTVTRVDLLSGVAEVIAQDLQEPRGIALSRETRELYITDGGYEVLLIGTDGRNLNRNGAAEPFYQKSIVKLKSSHRFNGIAVAPQTNSTLPYDRRLYWSELSESAVHWAAPAGTRQGEFAGGTANGDLLWPFGVAVDGINQKLYITEYLGRIYRCPLSYCSADDLELLVENNFHSGTALRNQVQKARKEGVLQIFHLSVD